MEFKQRVKYLKCFFASLLLLSGLQTFSQDTYKVPRSNLTISLPEGYSHIKSTNYFKGSHTGEYIRINQSYGNSYYTHIKTYTNDPGKNGMLGDLKVEKEKFVKISDFDGRYTHLVTSSSTGLHSYELVFGDSAFAVQILVLIRITPENNDAAIEKKLLETKYDRHRKVDYFETSGITFADQKNYLLDDSLRPGISVWRFLPKGKHGKTSRTNGFVQFSTNYFDYPVTERVVESQLTDILYSKGFFLYEKNMESTMINTTDNYHFYGQTQTYTAGYFVLHFAFVRSNILLNVVGVCPKSEMELIMKMDKFCRTVRFEPD